ncbi:MAG: hypothetical protein ACOCUT_04135, partial [bacterium]
RKRADRTGKTIIERIMPTYPQGKKSPPFTISDTQANAMAQGFDGLFCPSARQPFCPDKVFVRFL